MAPLHLSIEFEAIKHDVSKLFKRFVQHESVRFEDFAKEWRQMNFTFIFSCTDRNTANSKRRLTERLLRVVCEYLADEVPFLYRVACIYMMYAVYYKQPGHDKLKIRMTPTMYKDLNEFQEALIEHQHLDVAFVLTKLKNDGAFVFTAFPKYLNFGYNEFMFGTEGLNNFVLPLEFKQCSDDALSSDFIDNISSIENEYYSLKEKLLKDSNSSEKDFLSNMLYYTNPNFPQEMSQRINSYKVKKQSIAPLDKLTLLKNTQKPTVSLLHNLADLSLFEEEYASEKKPLEKKTLSRADKIAELKEKSFKAKVGNGPHGKRKIDDSISDDEPVTKQNPEDNPVREIFYSRGALLTPRIFKRREKHKRTHLRVKRRNVLLSKAATTKD